MNDVISAGSAVRATLADLRACGAEPVVIAAMLVLGDAATQFGLPLERLGARRHAQWEPDRCPLCADSVPLDDLTH